MPRRNDNFMTKTSLISPELLAPILLAILNYLLLASTNKKRSTKVLLFS